MSMPTETIIKSVQDSNSKLKSEEQILAENGFFWRESGGVKILVCRALEENGFINGFSTRSGGVSHMPENSLNLSGLDIDTRENVAENRSRFLKLFGDNFQIATVWQIHGDKIKTIKNFDEAQAETDEKFDAIVSGLPDLLVGVKTADCVPVLIGDQETKAFAAIHAGWRGTVQSIVPKAIENLKRNFGAEPQNLIVAIGAAALNCCYEIGHDVIDAFSNNFAASEHFFEPTRAGHARVNLHKANHEQILNTGVAPENVFVAPLCTMERTDLFFSYRVEKKLYGKTGRLLSVIGRKEK